MNHSFARVWFGKIFTFLCFFFFFNYKILIYVFYILGIKGNLFFSPKIWIYCILGLKSSCFIFSLAYLFFIYVFYAFDIIKIEILDIKKFFQISNIAYVQNYDNKYYMGNNIFILHLLSF